jgi:hypothetical protein
MICVMFYGRSVHGWECFQRTHSERRPESLLRHASLDTPSPDDVPGHEQVYDRYAPAQLRSVNLESTSGETRALDEVVIVLMSATFCAVVASISLTAQRSAPDGAGAPGCAAQ